MMRMCIILLILSVLSACGGKGVKSVDSGQPNRYFRHITPPAGLSGAGLMTYMQEHYWDRFDFADTLFIARADTSDMLSAFSRYVAYYVPAGNSTPIKDLMHRASSSKPMLEYFAMLGDKVLFDPTSPLRDGELYIPVAEAVLGSPYFDQWEKIAPEEDLRLAMQNRIGHKANDIDYTLVSGATQSLYSLNADYVLLFISNPACPMCREIRHGISSSPLLTEMIGGGELKVLMIYPDEDLAEWKAHLSEIPSEWINAYDKGAQIMTEQIYDLRAIPSLYLLDQSKRVLLKDASDVSAVEHAIEYYR